MRISAKTDYAVRAAAELAAAPPGETVKAERISTAQGIPHNFLENILSEMRHAGIVQSRRGPEGGFLLARAAAEISIADIIRAIDGPLAGVSGERPQNLDYVGAAEPLRGVWVAVRASLRSVLEAVTLADLAAGKLPKHVRDMIADEDAWLTH